MRTYKLHTHVRSRAAQRNVERRIRLLRVGREVIRLGWQNFDIHGV